MIEQSPFVKRIKGKGIGRSHFTMLHNYRWLIETRDKREKFVLTWNETVPLTPEPDFLDQANKLHGPLLYEFIYQRESHRTTGRKAITCFLQLGEPLAVDQVTQPSFEDTFSKHSQRWMNPVRLITITLWFLWIATRPQMIWMSVFVQIVCRMKRCVYLYVME